MGFSVVVVVVVFGSLQFEMLQILSQSWWYGYDMQYVYCLGSFLWA